MTNLMPGLEMIIGRNGKHYRRSILADIDENYLMKWFTRRDYATGMTKLYETLALEEHKLNLYGGLEVARQTSQLQKHNLDVDDVGGHVNIALDNDEVGEETKETETEWGRNRAPSIKIRFEHHILFNSSKPCFQVKLQFQKISKKCKYTYSIVGGLTYINMKYEIFILG